MRPESFQTGGEKSEKKLEDAEKGIWQGNNLRVAIEENKERAKSLKREIQKLKEELKALKEKYKQSKEWGRELEEKAKGITGREEEKLSQRDKDRDKETLEVKPEELKFKVIEGYFEEETREGIKDSGIDTISSFGKFVFAGRREGYPTLYQLNPEKGIMEVVEIEDQRKLLPGDILESEMNGKCLAVSGYPHNLRIYYRESDNPNDWFKKVERDLSDKFAQPVSALDLYQGLVGAGSTSKSSHQDSRILVYDLENDREILNNQKFHGVGRIYTFKFIPETNYAVIAGSNGIRIINYRDNGQIKWTGVDLGVGKAVSLSPNGKEIAFTDHPELNEIYFLDISDLDNLDSGQKPEGKLILDKDGEPIKSSTSYYRLSYTPDGKYLVIGSSGGYALTIIDRDSMKIVKQYGHGFGGQAIAIDQKGNIISTDLSREQLVCIKRGSK